MLDLAGFDLEDLSEFAQEEQKHEDHISSHDLIQMSCHHQLQQTDYLAVKLGLRESLMLKAKVPTSLILYFKYL